VPVVGGEGLPVGVAGARLLVARLAAGEEVELPGGRRQHVFVATGSVVLPEPAEEAVAGDAWRISDHPGLGLRARAASEVLVWDLP
jgi:quercetin 2,3-dioxygenase